MNKISVVIPCFCNERNIAPTIRELLENEQSLPSEVSFEYILVDDGSNDGTLSQLVDCKNRFPDRIKVVKLKSNVGSYNAIYAGIMHVCGDCIVVMSADQQDPPQLIREMYKSWQEGYEVVLAVRKIDAGVTGKISFAHLFRWVLRAIALPDLPTTGFDYCLFEAELGRRMIGEMPANVNSLYRLLTMGARVKEIRYEKRKRRYGKSMWSFKKKLKLALATLHYFYFGQKKDPTHFWKNKEAVNSTRPPFVVEKTY